MCIKRSHQVRKYIKNNSEKLHHHNKNFVYNTQYSYIIINYLKKIKYSKHAFQWFYRNIFVFILSGQLSRVCKQSANIIF